MECTETVPSFGMVKIIAFPVPAPDLIFRFTVVLLVPMTPGAAGGVGAGVVGAGVVGAGAVGAVTTVRYWADTHPFFPL